MAFDVFGRGATMPKLPDLSGHSFDELSKLVASATRRVEQIRGNRIEELQAELERLGPRGGRRGSRLTGKSLHPRSSRRSAQKRAPAVDRKSAAQFRRPNGEEFSGRGAIPRWARDLGVSDRAGLEN